MRTIPTAALAITAACSSAPPPQPPAPVRITQFYAAPPNPPKGQRTLVCYGVENATEVRLDPPIERLWPANARCFEYVPSKPLKLTITAARGSQQVSQSLEIAPGAPAVKLLEVSINKLKFSPGDEVMVCFKAKNASSAEIAWGKAVERNPAFGCISDHPLRTTTYTVTVTGAAGDTDSEKVTAQVK